MGVSGLAQAVKNVLGSVAGAFRNIFSSGKPASGV